MTHEEPNIGKRVRDLIIAFKKNLPPTETEITEDQAIALILSECRAYIRKHGVK